MVYNFNLGLGWASSGVEYAQAYRANILRRAGIPAKFVFMDMFTQENIEHFSKNIGFLDEEIIWLYTYFTDLKIAPASFTLKDLEATFSETKFRFGRTGKTCKYFFENNTYYTVYMYGETSEFVRAVDIVSNNRLIQKDYYTYTRVFSEIFAPLDKKAHVYSRRFYNDNGSVAYEEVLDGENEFYRFPDRICYSKQELIGYMVSRMNLTKDDYVIIDRTTGIGEAILRNCNDAKVIMPIHADHFNEGNSTEEHVLWNNYYEYAFAQHKHVYAYVTATDAQNQLLRKQFLKNVGVEPNVVTIPVGSLDALVVPKESRKKHSLITASRLAKEKHCDWLVEAVVKAHEKVNDVTLDIYGKGGEEAALKELIVKLNAQDYVHMMGQHKLDEVYQTYDAYFSASQSEGFGLSLMEAIGSGLPIIGFDVRYGNQTFIEDGKNGYVIPIHDKMDKAEKVKLLSEKLIKMFTEDDMEAFHNKSYEIAKTYLTEEVEKRWVQLLG